MGGKRAYGGRLGKDRSLGESRHVWTARTLGAAKSPSRKTLGRRKFLLQGSLRGTPGGDHLCLINFVTTKM
jgi:hypothetical protein